MTWNFNMDEAPRGEWHKVNRVVGKQAVDIDYYDAPIIIAAGSGGVVTTSRWLPKEGRWNMFTKSVPPIAWQPWPEHPFPTEKPSTSTKETTE